MCHELNAAAGRHDSLQIFQIINRYTPKRSHTKIKLRKRTGHLLINIKLMPCLFSMFNKPGVDVVHVPFTATELCTALAEIPSLKAVAPVCIPGLVVKHFAPLLAPILHSWLWLWWSGDEPWVPDECRSSWLIFIPETNRSCHQPKVFTLISLQEPIGKSIVGLLCRVLQNMVRPISCKSRSLPALTRGRPCMPEPG